MNPANHDRHDVRMHVPISVYIGRDHESGAGAQKWRQIGCDSESPLPVMRESKRCCY